MQSALKYCILLLASSTLSFAAEMQPHAPNPGVIRLVQVDPTPEGDEIRLTLVYPKYGEVKNGSSVNVEINLESYPLGVNSQFPRQNEIWNDPQGQSMHVFIDNLPYFSINESFVDSLDNNEKFFNYLYDEKIPFHLQPGMHVIRIFPVRSYNESLKGDKCFAASIFYYKSKKNNLNVDLNAPYLTYNEPQGEYDPNEPVLLDFYITNCQLSKDGYKVYVNVDGKAERIIQQWTPYYIYGLQKGTHTVRLKLLDPQNKVVPGMFNDIEKSFVIN